MRKVAALCCYELSLPRVKTQDSRNPWRGKRGEVEDGKRSTLFGSRRGCICMYVAASGRQGWELSDSRQRQEVDPQGLCRLGR